MQETIENTMQRVDPRALYRHQKRPEWGLAVVADRREGRLLFQFEDGGLRKIAQSHADLLQPVDVPFDRMQRALRKLEGMAGLSMARDAIERDEGEAVLTLDDQLAVFLHLHPDGFADERWIREQRGRGARRRLKRHRDPAIAQAQELLSESELRRLIAAQRDDEVLARVTTVFDDASLVTRAQQKPLATLPDHHRRAFSEALLGLLHGEGRYRLRLLRFLQPLASRRRAVSWPLATALPALVHPQKHVCVRPASFREQARWMAPRLALSNAVDAESYPRLLRMAKAVRDKLVERGQEPRDLLDVHDFMWCTLRPAARRVLVELAPEAPPSRVQGAESVAEAGEAA